MQIGARGVHNLEEIVEAKIKYIAGIFVAGSGYVILDGACGVRGCAISWLSESLDMSGSWSWIFLL